VIGSLASWVLSAASEHADSPLYQWQRCKRCGVRVDLPEDVAKTSAVYCGMDCCPPVPFQGVDVSHLRPMVRR
jgi:hypothetical protein